MLLQPDCPSPGRLAGIIVSDLSLQCHAELAPDPFGLQLLSSSVVADAHGEDLRSKPVARTLASHAPNLALGIALPLRLLRPQVQRTTRFQSRRLASIHARFPFAPRQQFELVRNSANGSSFQVRYVPSRLAVPLTSWNHLHDACDTALWQQENERNESVFQRFIWFPVQQLT